MRASASSKKAPVPEAPAMRISGAPFVVAWRINYLANHFTRPIYKEMERRFGLSRPDFVTLYCLSQAPGALARDIAALSGRPKNSISRAVNAMILRGLVAMEDGAGGRARPLRLTEAGVAVVAAAAALVQAREGSMLAPLDDQERAELERLLGKLAIRSDGWEAFEA